MSRNSSRQNPPASAATHAIGIVGVVGLLIWLAVARWFRLDGFAISLVSVLACGVPMIVWALLADRVHRNSSSGMDWDSAPRPISATIEISLTKVMGLWATWAVVACFYALFRWYWQGINRDVMVAFLFALPLLLASSIPWIVWQDRRLAEPRDGTYAFGRWLLGRDRPAPGILGEYARSWGVKAFFTVFMFSIVPGNFHDAVYPTSAEIVASPVSLARWLIACLFLIDVVVATVGYLAAVRPLDAHIRSTNPHLEARIAALACYPPFVIMSNGGLIDYHYNTRDWSYWLDGHPTMLWGLGAILVALTAVHIWSSVVFGLRFSNLTNRGILTHGPFRWTRHPAYLSKNVFWWLLVMPFCVTSGSVADILRNSALLAATNAIYYWRARTEERHLLEDPVYKAYHDWADRHAPLTRFFNRVCRRRPGAILEGDQSSGELA